MSNLKLPTFLVVGAVKAGTTSLHEYLNQHPEIFMSPVKETNFFSDADMLFDKFNVDYKQDIDHNLDKYLDGPMDKKIHIAHIRTWQQYQKLFRDVKEQKAIGEISNSYLYCPNTANAIHAQLPEAKIVMILRNPIDRLFSQYLMNLKLGKIITKDLLLEIQNDQDKKDKGWGVSHLYLEVGKYYPQVKNYFDIFSKNQVHVILYDDYKKDPAAVMQKLFAFIGVDANFSLDMSMKYNEAGLPRFGKLNYWLTQTGIYGLSKKIFPDSLKSRIKSLIYTKDNIPVISAEEKSWLVNYYKEDVEQLEKFLGVSLQHWLK
ncbi:MAG: sulfotransferase [Chitinophagales bacterium]|nr:sulfotransferase [Chitinophagales bacterium]MBP9547640.1 sulfotransferase [Chitinophagales bacterium]